MRYIGSKANLLKKIDEFIDRYCGKGNKIFCDIFCGTAVVSRYFKPKYQIISNDLMYFPYILSSATIENNEIPKFEKLAKVDIKDVFGYFDNLSVCKTDKSFIADSYSPFGKDKRMYFTEENARKIDAVRSEIENWKNKYLLSDIEYGYLLACVIEGIPLVSNITGTYGAYLKHWDKRALNKFGLVKLDIVDNKRENFCFNENANNLLDIISGDILYVDPPYNNRQYLPNYHILETVARYDFPEISGISGMRNYENEKSDYCIKSKVEKSFDELIKNAKFKHIVISYSDDGLLTYKNIIEILKKYCFAKSILCEKIPYFRYRNKMTSEKTEHFEYLFYARKDL